MNKLHIRNPIPVGRKGEKGQSLWLIASADDIDAGNLNGPGQKYDESTGEFTDVRPLQVWFKFGVWPGVDRNTSLPFEIIDVESNAQVSPLAGTNRGNMLVVASRDNPPATEQSDAAFWADLINEADGDNAIIVEPRQDTALMSGPPTEGTDTDNNADSKN